MLKTPGPNGRAEWAIRHRLDSSITGKWVRNGMEGGNENEIARRCMGGFMRGGPLDGWDDE